MNIIQLPPPPAPETKARLTARDIAASVEVEFQRRLQEHSRIFGILWKSADTPDDILAELNEMGVAGSVLQFARTNVEQIAAIAASVGISLTDVLPPSGYIPPRAFVVHEDGTVTLAPAEDGYDDWGKLIPVPEPYTELGTDPYTDPISQP